jgi:hypothetical protein
MLSPPPATLPAQNDLSGRCTLQPRHERGAALRANDAGRAAEPQPFAQTVAQIGIFQPLALDLRRSQTAIA